MHNVTKEKLSNIHLISCMFLFNWKYIMRIKKPNHCTCGVWPTVYSLHLHTYLLQYSILVYLPLCKKIAVKHLCRLWECQFVKLFSLLTKHLLSGCVLFSLTVNTFLLLNVITFHSLVLVFQLLFINNCVLQIT